MINTIQAQEFLTHRRLAVVGASDDPKNFGRTIYRELRSHGYDPVAVNPHATTVDGEPCFPDLASIPGDLDGVIVMLPHEQAVPAVRECAARGVPRIWLFKGIGGPGAVSDEAVELAHRLGLDVVAGACPLMFLEPVGWFHKVHRAVRRATGAVSATSN